MKILFLSQRFLLPMDTGGKIRSGKILEQLSRCADVTLVSNVQSHTDERYVADMGALCSRFVPAAWREVAKFSLRFYLRLLWQMLSRYPVSAINDYSRPLEDAVLAEARGDEYDLAICDFVQSALMFRRLGRIPTLLFQHNVESVIAKRHMLESTGPNGRVFWWLQWRKMLRYEASSSRSFDAVIAVSDSDRELFGELYGLGNVVAIPTGVDVDYFRPTRANSGDGTELVFCGSMDWLPNEDGVMFFIEEVLPRIRERRPDVRFTVVGRNPSPKLKRLARSSPCVALTGWVDDTRPYLERSAVCVVPLRIGGGTRLKIFEAMAMAKALVSTRIGAEGLPVVDGTNIFLEDDPHCFADRVLALLDDARLRRRVGIAAREYVTANCGWAAVAKQFLAICEETVRAHW